MTKIGKKAVQDFFAQFRKFLMSENRSPMVRKQKKMYIKGYGSAARTL
jgi:hypothetical protein